MSNRNQKLHAVLQARVQMHSGECTAEQALTRLVWEMLEPQYRQVMGIALVTGKLTTADVCTQMEVSANHASNILKQLTDDGLLNREPHIDERGLCYVYAPAAWVRDI